MAKKQKKFADDGWAVWIDGDDTSTVYINDWLNPKGNSYVDIAVRIRGVKSGKALYVYIPFAVSRDEIEDVSLRFQDTKILQATFSAACIVDYQKNRHTSEIAYNGKTVDIVHISTLGYRAELLADGTLISINLGVMNLLPVPALDGGRTLLILVEMITKKKLPPELEAKINAIGLFVLLGLSAIIMIKDVFGLFA